MKMNLRAAAAALMLVAVGSLAACQGAPTPTGDASVLNSMRSTKEQQREIYDCVKKAGWDVTFDKATGAILSSEPDAQQNALDAAFDKCSDKLGLTFNTPPNEEQLKVVYRWSKRIAACLKRNGWPTSTAPSFTTFSDTYDTDPWIPWISVPPGQMSAATKDCPVIAEGSGPLK